MRQWRELPNAPRVRDHFSAVASDGRMFLVGGRNTSHHELGNFTAFFGAVVPESDVYELESGMWSTLSARLDVPTAAGGLAVLDGSICYFGGETAQKVAHAETHRIDPETGNRRSYSGCPARARPSGRRCGSPCRQDLFRDRERMSQGWPGTLPYGDLRAEALKAAHSEWEWLVPACPRAFPIRRPTRRAPRLPGGPRDGSARLRRTSPLCPRAR